MRWNTLIGAAVLGVSLASQSFGFDLLERMLGARHHRGGNSCCETSCCEPAPTCCEPAPTCCEPAPAPCCEPAPTCCEPAPCDACNTCDNGCGRKKHGNLFAGLHKLFHKKSNCNSCNTCDSCAPACDSCAPAPCCEPAPAPCCEPAPTCCEPAPSCCEPAPCCESSCCGKKKQRLGDWLHSIFHKHRRCNSGCDTCAPACDSCGVPACSSCGSVPAVSTPAPAEEAAPMPPPAPMRDHSASYQTYQRRVVRTSAVH